MFWCLKTPFHLRPTFICVYVYINSKRICCCAPLYPHTSYALCKLTIRYSTSPSISFIYLKPSAQHNSSCWFTVQLLFQLCFLMLQVTPPLSIFQSLSWPTSSPQARYLFYSPFSFIPFSNPLVYSDIHKRDTNKLQHQQATLRAFSLTSKLC